MNQKQREISLSKIRNDDSIRVILISFKAGGAGLNLTACNNVILVDLWWNPALEVSNAITQIVHIYIIIRLGTSIRASSPIWAGT